MNERQEQLLKIIVDSYIERAEPVGSAFVVDNFDLDVSPATIRNDMAALEEDGYICQPHVSAGRIPTEAGYHAYLNRFLNAKPQPTARRKLERACGEESASEDALKDLARELVALSGETVVLSFGPRRVYYAGLSNLFQKPEFQDLALLQMLSLNIDQFENALIELAELLADEPRVFIGRQNPFGNQMSSVVMRYRVPQASGVLGLVGPMRMNYGRNMQLLQTTQEVLEEVFS
ncbi:TPA: hypothetical protein DDZ10_01255 [Candidatus Uhrbacteria bacterium]|nr:MAG: hypothetical protein A3D69_02795 [Candidatus Uhrbacteria bacterium RIFCSPHIGHO2_02_FULL_54_11]HBL39278.1 hypothetical protein [Candidatus Uhrbacteria bacterium]